MPQSHLQKVLPEYAKKIKNANASDTGNFSYSQKAEGSDFQYKEIEDESFDYFGDEDRKLDYYELYDKDTNHTLKFGKTKKDGSLFPRRKDTDGNWLSDGGWTKYDPNAPKVKSPPKEETNSAEIPF